MKILYGVQATGNGHITRARAMSKALTKHDFQVDYLFSGRKKDQFFDMDEFGDFACHSGLTFITEAGKVKILDTALKNNFSHLYRDIKNLDLSGYDLVLTDFEPISAWAARKQKKKSIAIGHQYAFDHKIPKKGNNPATALFMNYFAPADSRLGLHWHHFNQPILPPIADIHNEQDITIKDKIVVYLGFENLDAVIAYLTPFNEHQFYIYSNIDKAEDRGHLHLRPLSRDGFKQDLSNCNGVITNAGFELVSEAIHLGKKTLVKPLSGQMEQLSNAKALEQLSLGLAMKTLDKKVLSQWLSSFESKRIIYPDVASGIASWIAQGEWNNTGNLVNSLWQETENTNKDFKKLA